MEKKNKKKIDWLLWLLVAILACGIGFSGWKLYGILSDYHQAKVIYDSASETYTAARVIESTPRPDAAAAADDGAKAEPSDFLRISVVCDFSVDFENLWQTNGDIVGWISSPDTVIDYPVLLGETNDTYLHTAWDGTYSASGSIFLNCRCVGDLSDYETILYGHNMKSGAMFHALKGYLKQSYYDEHPYMWYVTPDAYYLLYVIACYSSDTSDEAYELKTSEEEVRDFIESARARSTLTPTWTVDGLDADQIAETAKRVVVLSTCSLDSDNARYIVTAVPLLAN